tara:strand:- start:1576 stop:1821 length:246 start_codon:yes stop_codon:yes gene_type:complete
MNKNINIKINKLMDKVVSKFIKELNKKINKSNKLNINNKCFWCQEKSVIYYKQLLKYIYVCKKCYNNYNNAEYLRNKLMNL